MSMSADGYVTTLGGWPALTADPAFVSGKSHGIQKFLESCEQAMMGRTTFEPGSTTSAGRGRASTYSSSLRSARPGHPTM
jgi:hypothetical protein